MNVIKEYKKLMVETILRINPSLDELEVERIVDSRIKTTLKDPSINMDNNVTGDNTNTTLTGLCNWIDKKKPVISGNATFYMQPVDLRSPTSFMLKTLKKERKSIKREMFEAQKSELMDKYARLDLDQMNTKVIMNAEYGGSGAPTAAFYTKYSPPATTLMAQSIITIMAAFFEGYVGGNHKFFHINECIDWMNTVINKKDKVHNWIKPHTVAEVSHQIKSHMIELSIMNSNIIDMFVEGCTEDDLIYLYYANNMKGLISENGNVQKIISNILSSLPTYEATPDEVPDAYKSKFVNKSDYNGWVSSEMFLNPYKPPVVIKEDLSKLEKIINQYIYVEYLTPDSIVKLNNHKRNAVLLVDTDSNVINSDLFVDLVLNQIFPNNNFCRSKMYNEMICVNILASIIDKSVASILNYFGIMHNMDEESRSELTMKNEFMFKVLFLMKNKKRYVASLVLREGNIMMPFKVEIKGMDFIKAGVTPEVKDRLTKLLKDNILFSDTLELRKLNRDLKMFEREIYEDLKSGGIKYLQPKQYKPEGGYKKVLDKTAGKEISGGWSIPIFKAVTLWNIIYPINKIYSLDRAKLIKLTITKADDLKVIERSHPEIYNTLIEKVFNSPDPNIRKAGMKYIALPSTVQSIPDWIINFIDYNVMVSDVISSFASVMKALDIRILDYKTANGKANAISSLISI